MLEENSVWHCVKTLRRLCCFEIAATDLFNLKFLISVYKRLDNNGILRARRAAAPTMLPLWCSGPYDCRSSASYQCFRRFVGRCSLQRTKPKPNSPVFITTWSTLTYSMPCTALSVLLLFEVSTRYDAASEEFNLPPYIFLYVHVQNKVVF